MATFPLAISSDKRSLNDAKGNPFLMQGDSAWSAIAELSEADATKYLDDRKGRGFNTLLISLIEHKFTSHNPPWLDAAGDAPFSDTSDFTTTNAAYFAHVDWFLDQAKQRGFLVLLVPSYLGYGCGDEGWCAEMKANGTTKLGQYGDFVGARYKGVPNILWVEGGDHTPSTAGNPSEMDLVNAIADGIKKGDGGAHLHTAHWGSETLGAAVPSTWLDVDSVYTYQAPYVKSLEAFSHDDGVRPFFLIESSYENEHGSSPGLLRSQMYEPVLAGGTGFLFGNFPIWAFWKPGDAPWQFDDGHYPGGWTTALDTPGAHDATVAGAFFRSIAWSELRPDVGHQIMTSGPADALLASSTDTKLAVVYFASSNVATIDLSHLKVPLTGRWVDPSSGTSSQAPGSPFAAGAKHDFTPPGARADSSGDWLLVLEAQ
jgi:hypothetical protein